MKFWWSDFHDNKIFLKGLEWNVFDCWQLMGRRKTGVYYLYAVHSRALLAAETNASLGVAGGWMSRQLIFIGSPSLSRLILNENFSSYSRSFVRSHWTVQVLFISLPSFCFLSPSSPFYSFHCYRYHQESLAKRDIGNSLNDCSCCLPFHFSGLMET